MTDFLRKLSTYVGGALAVLVFACGVVAYFVLRIDPETRQWFDGFGRPLEPSPWFMRALFGQERLWAGWTWFVVDLFVFWGGLALALSLFFRGERNQTTGQPRRLDELDDAFAQGDDEDLVIYEVPIEHDRRR